MLKVKKVWLMLIAGLIWLAAGANILRIGIQAFVTVFGRRTDWLPYGLVLAAIIVLTGFSFMFYRIVGKHIHRILGYTSERVSVFLFFDVKGYILMGFMMLLGIVLRQGGFLPDEFFAAFYTGLGSALSIAGLRFVFGWWGAWRKDRRST